MSAMLLSPRAGLALARPTKHICRRQLVIAAAKGFGSEPKTTPRAPEEDAPAAPSSASPATTSRDRDSEALEALEARIKSRRKVEPKVKVVAPAVDVATGKAPVPRESAAEQVYLNLLGGYFLLLLWCGLALAGAGFLPEAVDQWIQDELYPNYSAMMVMFLVLSSLYGLYKTGKLPGQKQELQ